LLLAAPLRGQNVGEISSATRLRKAPDGIPLVSLPAGTEVETKKTRGDWHEVVVNGWIFTNSTSPTHRDGFDLVVSAPDGENLRAAPNGEIVGRARNGALLRKLETTGGWTHVSRAGWVPKDAVSAAVKAYEASAEADTPAVAQPAPSRPPSPSASTQGAATSTAASTTPGPAKPTADNDRAAVARATGLFATPQGGQYGTLETGAPAEIIGRNGDWVHVQAEGWVREADLEEATGDALTGVTAAEVRSDPGRYVGKTVEWRLQLIAVQTADELRTEIPKGQTYLLTRGPLPEPGFVYVIVSPSQATEFGNLPALQELTLRVTIKAAKTKYLTTPVVEYVSRVGE
jgi:hypothetical protein